MTSIPISSIIQIQASQIKNKKLGWYTLAFAQVFIIFYNLPKAANFIWPLIHDCLVPDKNNDGEPLSFQLNYTEENCLLLPGDLKLTVV